MITKEPEFNIKDVFGVLFISVGYLLFLFIIHILTLNTNGSTASVLSTLYDLALNLFYFLIIILGAFTMIHFLRWLVWITTTPKWWRMRDKVNLNKYNGKKM